MPGKINGSEVKMLVGIKCAFWSKLVPQINRENGKITGGLNISKNVPDYASGYKNEFRFIRGIDNSFEYFLENIIIRLLLGYSKIVELKK